MKQKLLYLIIIFFVALSGCTDADVRDFPAIKFSNKILIDATHDGGVWWFPQLPANGLSQDSLHQGKALANFLKSEGFEVDELPSNIVITDSILQLYNKVIRVGFWNNYAESELKAYDNFLNRGSSLLLISEYMRPGERDMLAERLGIKFAGIAYGQLSRFDIHPVTEGATSFYYNAGSGVMNANTNPDIHVFGWLSSSDFLDLNDNGVLDPGEPTGPPVMGYLSHPYSKIIFLGDGNGLEGIPQPLTLNIVKWLFL